MHIRGKKQGAQTTINNTGNQSAIRQFMSRGSSVINKFSNFMSKNSNGTSVPTGKSKSALNNLFRSKAGIVDNSTNYKKIGRMTASPQAAAFKGVLGLGAIVGAAGMVGVSMMNGMMSQAQDIAADRYMRDSRYSSRLLAQTNLGQSSGQSRINLGNHTGLGLALHRGRHG